MPISHNLKLVNSLNRNHNEKLEKKNSIAAESIRRTNETLFRQKEGQGDDKET